MPQSWVCIMYWSSNVGKILLRSSQASSYSHYRDNQTSGRNSCRHFNIIFHGWTFVSVVFDLLSVFFSTLAQFNFKVHISLHSTHMKQCVVGRIKSPKNCRNRSKDLPLQGNSLPNISPVGDWRSTSLEWPWPWFRPYGIPSCITHRPLPT